MPGDDQEKRISHQAGGQSQEPGEIQLKELFEKEIASIQGRRNHRIVVALFISSLLVLLIYGFIAVSSQQPFTPVSGTIQPTFSPAPDSVPPTDTPIPGAMQPTGTPVPEPSRTVYPPAVGSQEGSSGGTALVINGKANPGFPYWPSGTITYRLDPANLCSPGKTSNIIRAFRLINDKTDDLVSFVRSPDGNLVIGCLDSPGAPGESGWAGLRLSPEGYIDNATIELYNLPPGTSECDSYPTLEMHETLHTLGFEDTSSGGNLMNLGQGGGTWPCREMDAGIVNCLKNIYSNGRRGQPCTGIPHR